MAYTYAGRYGPEALIDLSGNALVTNSVQTTSVLVKTTGGAPATLYTDKTKSTAAGNPVTTDAKGNLGFFTDPGDYDLVATVAGVVQPAVRVTVPVDPSEVDQIPDIDLTGITDGDSPRWDQAAGKFKRTSQKVFDVRDYGAVAGDVGNQIPAFHEALAAADDAGGGHVIFDGVYRGTEPLIIPGPHITFGGVGESPSQLHITDLGAGEYAIDCGNFGVDAPQLHDFTVRCGSGFTMGVSPAAMYGIKATSRVYMRRVAARGFKAGVVITGDHVTLDVCHIKANYYNVYFGPGGSTYGNHHFMACDLSNCTFASVAVAPDNIIDGTLFAGGHGGWGPYGIYKESGASSKGLLYETTLQEFYFEAIGNGAILDEGSGGSGQETLYGCKLINCYFAWDTPYGGIYKIPARNKDWTIKGRLMVGTEIWADASPFADGDVGTWNLTSVTNSVIHQPIGTLPKVVAACRGNLRWNRTGKDSGSWYTAQNTIANKDLIETLDFDARTLGTQSREFFGVACAAGSAGDIIPIATAGLVDVVVSSVSGVAHGGMPLVVDLATPTKVAVPTTQGSNGYADGNTTAVPSRYPIIGMSRTGASANAGISVDLDVRHNRGYVCPAHLAALPTASATYRGQLLRVEGGGGVADLLYVCMKAAGGTYSWVQVATG